MIRYSHYQHESHVRDSRNHSFRKITLNNSPKTRTLHISDYLRCSLCRIIAPYYRQRERMMMMMMMMGQSIVFGHTETQRPWLATCQKRVQPRVSIGQ